MPATHDPFPVQPIPPHWYHFPNVPAAAEVVAALLVEGLVPVHFCFVEVDVAADGEIDEVSIDDEVAVASTLVVDFGITAEDEIFVDWREEAFCEEDRARVLELEDALLVEVGGEEVV